MRVRRWTKEPAYLCRVDFELSLSEVVDCCVIAAESNWFPDDPEMNIVPRSVKDVDRRVRSVLARLGVQALSRMGSSRRVSAPRKRSVQAVVCRLFADT